MAQDAVALLEKNLEDLNARLEGFDEIVQERDRTAAAIAVLRGDAPTPRAARIATPARPSSSGQRAPRGANRQAILVAIGDRPGISVAEIASVTKIAKPTVATSVSQMKKRGEIEPEGDGGLRLVTA